MVCCSILSCRSRSGQGCGRRFFSIPTVIKNQCDRTRLLSMERRKLWLLKINRSDIREENVTKNRTVCDLHFISGAPSRLFDTESPDWAPNINMGYERTKPKILDRARLKKKTTAVKNEKLPEAVKFKDESMEIPDSPEPLTSDAACMTEDDLTEPYRCDAASMTDVLTHNIDHIQSELKMTRDDNIALRTSNQDLQNKLNYCIVSEVALQCNNDKVKFYTGMPAFSVLKSVYDLVTKDVDWTLKNSLPPFQEFLVVFMRLRLNLLEQDLAYRFGVSQATISRIHSRWLPLMADRLRCFIAWPDRESLKAVVPQLFKEILNDNVCILMDCIEFFITRPSSQYKYKQTGVKFLIGITPQGSISYISRVPHDGDEDIIENCGILDHLTEGDLVIVNPDLNSNDNAGFGCGKVVYTDKPQLEFEYLVPAKCLNNLKKYMENIIGFVRQKFHILKEALPPEVLIVRKEEAEAPVDHIVVICCALANLCRSVVIDQNDKTV